jgi:hypothetical protein
MGTKRKISGASNPPEAAMTLRSVFAAVVVCIAGFGCASTSVVDTWRNPNYSGGPARSVLVVGISKQPSVRQTFEDEFTKRLQEKGVKAVASYTVIPEAGQVTADRLRTAVEESGLDGVIITRLAKVEKQRAVSPEYGPPYRYGSYYGFYGDAWTGYYEPAPVYEYDVVVLQTTLFLLQQEKPVWSGTTETFAPQNIQKETAGFAEQVIKAMSRDRVI